MYIFFQARAHGSHIEVQPGWLEPIMQRIFEEPKAVIMPQIDSIVPETFEPQVAALALLRREGGRERDG